MIIEHPRRAFTISRATGIEMVTHPATRRASALAGWVQLCEFVRLHLSSGVCAGILVLLFLPSHSRRVGMRAGLCCRQSQLRLVGRLARWDAFCITRIIAARGRLPADLRAMREKPRTLSGLGRPSLEPPIIDRRR